MASLKGQLTVAGMKGPPGACGGIMRPCGQQARLNGQRIPSSCEMARAADGQVRKAQHAGTLARLAPARARRILRGTRKIGAPRQCATARRAAIARLLP
ncbi:MAG: hypothetical protein EB824_02325 [Thaumarchaeota archaeon S15]|nr:MAG: hypothetical protein EB824_02325 [Thaumarchaeota archaeon S15]